MASLGVDRLVIKKVLNHVESDVTAIYDRHSYDAEKREALERWAGRLEAFLAGPWGAQTSFQHSQGSLGLGQTNEALRA